ncbi:hypothetical protein [Pseudoalteromonas sp. S1688]|uniref:hypothetical protein n=1 Tax=Pseudoalteromonas sp. S1688 TaxID=579511 RepID=UPI00110A8E3A|nr:hypothetical protein [Pseudoalteromonas sp. S1688]TMP51454.1 hypothetical protein CWB81_05885 [Pseudoalteromonas sp. S1688]
MTRPCFESLNKARLERYFEAWARWVHSGHVSASKSILQKIMDGDSFTRSGGGSSPIIDCVELNIESALMRLKVSNEAAVTVCRVEYGALYLKNLPVDANRETRALRMGMSLRTYNRRLADARTCVELELVRLNYL